MRTPQEIFTSIPSEVFGKLILSYLSLSDLITLSKLKNRFFYKLSRNNSLWQHKFNSHFSHLQTQSDNWYASFISTMKAQYSEDSYLAFYIAKEGDRIAYKKYLHRKQISLDDFVTQHDKQERHPLEWIIKRDDQRFLDEIYRDVTQAYFVRVNSIDKTIRDSRGWSVGHWACLCNQNEQTMRSCFYGVDFSTFDVTPFHLAAEFGLNQKINFFIANHWYINSPSTKRTSLLQFGYLVKADETPLHLASSKGHHDIVEQLLQNGADPYAVMSEASSDHEHAHNTRIRPIHCATKNNHLRVVTMLLNKGCSPLLRDTFDNSPLRYCIENDNREIFDLFMQKLTTKITGENDLESLNQALFYAVEKQNIYYVQELLNKGANPQWAFPTSSYYCYHCFSNRTAIDLAIDLRNVLLLEALTPSNNQQIQNLKFQPAKVSRLLLVIGGTLGVIAGALSVFVTNYTSVLNCLLNIVRFCLLGIAIGFLIGKLIEQKMKIQASFFLRNLSQKKESPALPPENVKKEELISITTLSGQEHSNARLYSRLNFLNSNKNPADKLSVTELSTLRLN